MVKVSDGPVQLIPLLVYVGVTVIVEPIDELEVFIAVNGVISPVPLAASPVDVLSLVQL
jgi:hypothetical protein